MPFVGSLHIGYRYVTWVKDVLDILTGENLYKNSLLKLVFEGLMDVKSDLIWANNFEL